MNPVPGTHYVIKQGRDGERLARVAGDRGRGRALDVLIYHAPTGTWRRSLLDRSRILRRADPRDIPPEN